MKMKWSRDFTFRAISWTLKEWRVATYSDHAVSYFTYLTFKIADGKVVAVIP